MTPDQDPHDIELMVRLWQSTGTRSAALGLADRNRQAALASNDTKGKGRDDRNK